VCFDDVGRTETNHQLEVAVKEASERLAALHHLERQSVRSALIEERGRLCLFVCGLKPVMVSTVQFAIAMIISIFTTFQRTSLLKPTQLNEHQRTQVKHLNVRI